MRTVKLDVTKVDKNRLFQGKNGAKYLDLVLFENRDGPDKFGNDGFVTQSCSKEEREKGVKMPILGSWKRIGGSKKVEKPATPKAPPADGQPPEDEVPF